MKHLKPTIAVAAIATLMLGACQPDASKPDAKPAPSVPVTSEPTISEPVVTAPEKPALKNLVSGRFDYPGGPVTVGLTLQSDAATVEDQGNYTKTYPPMPAIIDTMSIYQLGDGYRFFSRDAGLDVMAGTAATPTTVELVQNAGGAYVLRVDGTQVASGDGPLVKSGSYRLYSNGSGRDWSGTISSFTVTAADGTVTNVPVE